MDRLRQGIVSIDTKCAEQSETAGIRGRLDEVERQLKHLGDFLEEFCPKRLTAELAEERKCHTNLFRNLDSMLLSLAKKVRKLKRRKKR